jgi:hypothetical protein
MVPHYSMHSIQMCEIVTQQQTHTRTDALTCDTQLSLAASTGHTIYQPIPRDIIVVYKKGFARGTHTTLATQTSDSQEILILITPEKTALKREKCWKPKRMCFSSLSSLFIRPPSASGSQGVVPSAHLRLSDCLHRGLTLECRAPFGLYTGCPYNTLVIHTHVHTHAHTHARAHTCTHERAIRNSGSIGCFDMSHHKYTIASIM